LGERARPREKEEMVVLKKVTKKKKRDIENPFLI
jgi:hypothetical protein